MNRQSQERQNRIAKGLCKHCVKPRISGHSWFCEKHYIAHCAQNAIGQCSIKVIETLQERFNTSAFCPYTGEPLVLGENAHLDHIKSKKNRPDLARNIDNLEWVSAKANLAKNSMDKEEFISFVQSVSSRFPY